MENRKNVLIITLLIIAILIVGTYSFFRRSVSGNINASFGNLNLVVNGVDSVSSETVNVTLVRSEEEPYILPNDKGMFNFVVNSTGSVVDVMITFSLVGSDYPENLKFYLDEDYQTEITKGKIIIEQASSMEKTIPIYWFWDGSVDDENDVLYMDRDISLYIDVHAMTYVPFYELLVADAELDTDVDFGVEPSIFNGWGLMMMNSTKDDEYPIVYYRGDVSNNNVIFADHCWLIVRTTETGGIKLVFNGSVNDDGSCNNYSGVGGQTANANYTDIFAGNLTTSFNKSSNSPVYVGYMYNDTNKFSSSGTLDADGYKAHLSDNTVDQETGRHVQNLKDSTIKGVMDDWYEANIKGKPEESLLEDTIWCNDRSVISERYSIENYAINSLTFYFAAYTRLYENTTVTPSLVCARDMDKFTVDSSNGNGDLDYPIGLLTADEMNLAGEYTYLSTPGSYYRTLSPSYFNAGNATVLAMFGGSVGTSYTNSSSGVRPSISLGLNTAILSGNGSFEAPYIVG